MSRLNRGYRWAPAQEPTTDPERNAQESQIFYARIAGFVYLLLIVLYMSGDFLISDIVGDSEFAETAQRVVASERTYRLGLILQMLTSASTVVLAYALYVTVRPVNERLAQMAMFWRLGESFIGAVVVVVGFAKLRILAAAADAASGPELEQWQSLMMLARSAGSTGFNISTLFFGVGSIVFFNLFLKARYIPKVQSVFGIFASILVVFTSLAGLLLPEHAGMIQLGWLPMFISEIVTGLWLLLRGIRVQSAMGSGSLPSTK